MSLVRHKHIGIENYHSEVWADRGGYFVYMPALFIYGFHAEDLPDSEWTRVGFGFSVENGKLIDKYPVGPAILESPFYLGGHLLAKIGHKEANGFSEIYYKTIDVAAAFYSACALLLLYFFLIRYVRKDLALAALAVMYLGTNVFWYSVVDTGMSHIYSFFLFACFLYLSSKVLKEKARLTHCLLFGLVIGLIIEVRAINAVFLPFLLLLNPVPWHLYKKLIGRALIILAAIIVAMVPQFLYWHYLSGHWIYDSYQGESFTQWRTPWILHLWFSTLNGLFIYSPLFLVAIIGMVVMLLKDNAVKGLLLSGLFLFASYLFGSWHVWHFGCSYGCRPMVGLNAAFTLPMAYGLRSLGKNRILLIFSIVVILILIAYNLKLADVYDGCWYGGDWDFKEWWRVVSTKMHGW